MSDGKKLAIFVLYCLALTVLVMAILWGAKINHSNQNDSKNAHMVQLFERGVYREQYMCDQSNGQNCLLLRTPGLTGFQTQSIKVGGAVFVASSPMGYKEYGAGIYCPGAVDMMSCFEVVTLKYDQNCPGEITYWDFKASLYPDSCVILK